MREEIGVRGLDDLKRALEKIASNTSKPFQEMDERLRHEKIVRIQSDQLKLSQQQNKFNLVLALATTVLAVGIFLQIILYIVNEGMKIRNFHWFFQIIFILGIGILLAFIGGIIIVLTIILTKKNETKKNRKP